MRSPDSPALAQARRSEQALGVSVALCALSAATLLWVGVTPATAWTFILGLLLVVLPFAYGLARGLFLLETLLRGRGLVPPVGLALGVAVTWGYSLHNPVFSCLLLLAIVGVDCRRDRPRLRYVAAVVGTMFTGFVTVSNLSYLIARLTFDRVHDPALRDLDLTIYRAFVPGLRYEGLFPLTDSALWFHLLENAYMKLFPEIVVVLVVLHRSTSRAATSPVVALGTIALAAWRRQLSTWLAWCLFLMAYLILCPHLTATEDMALFCVLVGLERAGIAKGPTGARRRSWSAASS